MTIEEQTFSCGFWSNGRIVKHFEGISFLQWSDRGHVHCRTAVAVGVCEGSGAGSPEQGAGKIVDEAFRRERDRHIAHWRSVIGQG